MTESEFLSTWRALASPLSLAESAAAAYGALLWAGGPLAIPAILDRAGTTYGPTWAGLERLVKTGAVEMSYPQGSRKAHYRATSGRTREEWITVLSDLQARISALLP
jgi:DNA-binding transcriptional regulator GbsR (MarR family)